jgi:hypothetical protein
MKTNFSQIQTEIFELALDLGRGDFSRHIDETKVTKKDLENHLRDLITNDMLGGKTLYQAVRRNKIELYEIVEELVNVTLRENIVNSPFMDTFVDFKDRGLGDKSEFYAEGGLLSVATFAGNHWDTYRQSLDIGDVVTLPKEWVYIHVYEELERFLLGIVGIDKIMDKIYKSVNKYIQDRIYAQFNNVANAVPSDFSATGNTEAAVGALVDKVQAAGGYASMTIAGTKGALRKLATAIPDKMFANSQKEAKAQTGSIGEWEGNTLMIIPQTLQSGTFNLALSDDKIFIMGADAKPIKFEIFGDTRTKSNTDGQANNDMTIDAQIQTKIGLGLVISEAFGVFTFQ